MAVLDTLRAAPDRADFEVDNLVIPSLSEVALSWTPEDRFDLQ